MKTREFLIFAPGLATKGRSERIVRKVITNLKENGREIELVKVDYPSHKELVITNFELDLEEFKKRINLLKKLGRVGICGVCYGAYLSTRISEEVDYNLLVEPYFGHSTLKGPYKKIAQIVKQLPELVKPMINLPVTNKGKITQYINIPKLVEFTSTETEITGNTHIVNTSYHHFFKNQTHPNQTEYSKEDILNEDPQVLVQSLERLLDNL